MVEARILGRQSASDRRPPSLQNNASGHLRRPSSHHSLASPNPWRLPGACRRRGADWEPQQPVGSVKSHHTDERTGSAAFLTARAGETCPLDLEKPRVLISSPRKALGEGHVPLQPQKDATFVQA